MQRDTKQRQLPARHAAALQQQVDPVARGAAKHMAQVGQVGGQAQAVLVYGNCLLAHLRLSVMLLKMGLVLPPQIQRPAQCGERGGCKRQSLHLVAFR
ncbi:hypothetical protein D3C81_700820 [compost metagenome]